MTAWTPIPGFGRYDVTPEGDVRSRRRQPARLLHPRLGIRGYLVVCVRDDLGKPRNVTVHSLVVRTFIGPLPGGMHVNHKDGHKLNNRVENLEVVTPAENARHAIRLGLWADQPKGDDGHATKFRFVEVEAMRALRDRGWTLQRIADAFGASVSHVSELCRRLHRSAA